MYKRSKNKKSSKSENNFRASANSSKRGSSRRQDPKEKEWDESSKGQPGNKVCNDPAWWNRHADLARTAGNLNFTYPAGYAMNLNNPLFEQTPSKGAFTVPGIMAINLWPTYGNSTDGSSAINLSSFKTYAFMRSQNSGARNYEAPDLTLYMMAAVEIFSAINWVQRIYRLARTYTFENVYLPKAVFDLERIDYDDVARQLARFDFEINLRIDKARQLLIPNTMPIANRRSWLYKDIFIEGTSVKDQMYFLTPSGFGMFELDEDGAGSLRNIELYQWRHAHGYDSGWTVDALFEFIDELISAISTQEDFLIMAGDIYKAYGDAGIVKLDNFSGEGFVALEPIFSIEMLEQIANANAFLPGTSDQNWNPHIVNYLGGICRSRIKQDPTKSFLVTEYEFGLDVQDDSSLSATLKLMLKGDSLSHVAFSEKRILTTSTGKTDSDLVLENTRLMMMCESVEYEPYGEWPRHFRLKDPIVGTECVANVQVILFHVSYDASGQPVRSTTMYKYGYVEAFGLLGSNNAEYLDQAAQDLKIMNALNFFKFHPPVHWLVFKEGTESGSVSFADALLQTDVDNYTIITHDVLRRLHETCLISALDV